MRPHMPLLALGAACVLCALLQPVAAVNQALHHPTVQPEKNCSRTGTWGAPSDPKKGAWVFVAAIGDLTRHYYDLLLASVQCMSNTNSKYDTVLLYEGELNEEVQTAFKALGIKKVYRYPDYFVAKDVDLSALEEKSRPAREQNHFWHKCWNKLAAWTLTKYEKVVVLDPDVVAWENSDELFEYPELSAVPDYGFQVTNREHIDTFNSGFMVLQPSYGTYRKMAGQLKNYESWFVDQGFLNDYYKRTWHQLPLAYQLWPGLVQHGIPGIVNASVVKFVHHVSESACWECDLGWKTAGSCAKHICPQCCNRVVQCREQAYARIDAYKAAHGISAPYTLGIHSKTAQEKFEADAKAEEAARRSRAAQ